jgi:hypothetical protein
MTAILGTTVIAPIVPGDTTDVFPSHDAIYGRGGLTHADNVAARDAITAERRRAGMLCYVIDEEQLYQLKPDLVTWEEFSGGGGASERFSQASHGFTVGQPIRLNGSTWVLAQGDAAANAEAAGLVSVVNSVDEFTVVYCGPIKDLPFAVIPGEVYFLDGLTPGALALMPPTDPGTVSKPVLLATGTDKGVVLQMRGMIIPAVPPTPGTGSSTTFTRSSTSPVTVFELPSGQALTNITVEILEAWDGVGASIEVGVPGDTDRYIEASDLTLGVLALFATHAYDVGVLTIIATINPGAGSTTGQARIQITAIPVGA